MERRTRARSRLPPPCGEVGLLSAHARRRPGGGELGRPLRRLDVAQRFERSPHPARLCAVAQDARRPPHKGEVSSRLALLIDTLEPYAIALRTRGRCRAYARRRGPSTRISPSPAGLLLLAQVAFRRSP